MIKVSCSRCQKPVEVANLLAAVGQPCPHCGGLLFVGDESPPEPAPESTALAEPRERGWWARLTDRMLDGRVLLFRNEVRRLPPVCMRCGADADVIVDEWFRSGPPLPGGNWMQLRVPLCEAHRNHLLWRRKLFPIALALLAIAVFCATWGAGLAAAWGVALAAGVGLAGWLALAILGVWREKLRRERA